MATLTIVFADDRLEQLRELAEQAEVTPEEFARRHLEELLAQPDEAFRRAAAAVLRKNAELYRRLA